MNIETEIFIDKVKNLCVQFDKIHENYPEHPYEGWAFYEFVRERILDETSEPNSRPPQEWFPKIELIQLSTDKRRNLFKNDTVIARTKQMSCGDYIWDDGCTDWRNECVAMALSNTDENGETLLKVAAYKITREKLCQLLKHS